MKKVLEKLSDMNDVLFGCLVWFEIFVICMNYLVIILKKVVVNDVKGFVMEEGFIKFKFFVIVGDIGGGDINV